MIATRDIAARVCDRLVPRDFAGHSVAPLMGPRDYTMREVAAALAAAAGRSAAAYVQVPYADVKEGMTASGVSASVAEGLVGFFAAINRGVMTEVDRRTAASTTATTIEQFAAELFGP